VNEYRWINPQQPQTLYMAVMLCYIDAVFGVLSIGVYGPLMILVIGGLSAGGFGIANEKKFGYAVAVAAAVGQVLLLFNRFGTDALTSPSPLVSLLFDGALVALLLHPMSRDYQRIWFK
jgi:hypothetical protein